MKHLLWLLLLPLAAHAACSPGPNWCIAAPVLSATSVTAGSPITVTMAFTSVAAVTNETLDIEVWDAGNPSAKVPGCQVWQTGINFTAGQTVTETANCTIPATATTALYTVNVGLFEASGMQDFYGFVTNFTVSAATPPQTAPPCFPKVQWPLAVAYGSLPAGVSTRYDTYAAWVCQVPSGYLTTANLFTLANVAPFALQYVLGTWTAAQAATDCASTCVAPTASEQAFIQQTIATDKPRALVAFNGASLTRSVYTANPDGTLNATAVAGETVAVATPCDETTRIATSPAYFSVSGQADQNGSKLAPGLYAICIVSLPIGAN